MIRERILEALEVFKYDAKVQKMFLSILDVRFDRDSEVRIQVDKFLSAKQIKTSFLDALNALCVEEIKRLNAANLQERLAWIEQNHVNETVVIAYLKLLLNEIKTQPIVTSSALIEAERKMFEHLLHEAHYNEDLTELEGISNLNLRLVLQSWVLYPEMLHSPEQCDELLECLSVSSYRF